MAVLEDLRVKTAELLDEGLSAGVLSPEEHTWRTGHLARAATVEELEVLVEDLLLPEPASTARSVAPATPRSSQMTVMSSRTFTAFDLGRRSELVTIMGSTRIDLREWAVDQALTLELVTVMGDAVIEVPPGMRVRVECTPVMGDLRIDPAVRSADAGVKITGVVLMGSLRVVEAKRSPAAR